MSDEGFTVWFTGVTCSGKSTLAAMLRDALTARGCSCEVLDSGRIRQALNRSLGFTRDEIADNLKRIAYECKLLNRNGVVAIVAAVSPYRDLRDGIRSDVGRFLEVYCRCPMEVLAKRDKSGLFDKAKRGELAHVAGVNAPYEEPFKPEVLINTDTDPPHKGVARIVSTLEILGYLPKQTSAEYTAEEEAIIRQRLHDLGYI
ncbi:MAG TPA: adenylyl-sulfate kinase [Phycisphaerae bacterium]|nr:adenylyl-sulfate kinase [Phycisphaerae bacterium]